MRGLGLALVACAELTAAGCVSGPPLPPPPLHANGQVLWRIVHAQCVPDQVAHGDPAPCAQVSLAGGEARGFAVLKDRNGVAQYLLLPTARISGIEDPALIGPGGPNYFAEAWAARSLVAARLGGVVPHDEIAVAVNSAYGRSQDQLHLHVDCVAFSVRDALRANAPGVGAGWSEPTPLAGHSYRVEWLDGAELQLDPFRRLAETIPGAARAMGAWTLVLIGGERGGRAGFYLLAARADPAHGETASGETVQDHACVGQRAELAAAVR